MVGFYKHDIPSWMDGTESLSDGAYRAYHVICQLIYLNEGPIALNEHGIAGRCRQSVRSFRKHLDELISSGKLRLENGRLANSRAEKELEKIDENRMNAREGGINSGRSRNSAAKPLKVNDADEAPLQEDRSLKDKTRLDKTSISAQSADGRKPSRRKAKEPIADDFAILPTTEQYGIGLGLSKNEMGRELERFRNHAKQNDRRCADWQMALRNWFMGAAERLNKTPPGSREQIDWEHEVMRFQGGARWPFRTLGPEPGDGGCKVPRDVLEKFNITPA